MPDKRPPTAASAVLIGGAVTVGPLLYLLAVTGTPRAQAVAVAAFASFSFILILMSAFYFRLRWSGLRSMMTSMAWWSLSFGCLLLLMDPLALWTVSAVLIGFSVFVLKIYAKRL